MLQRQMKQVGGEFERAGRGQPQHNRAVMGLKFDDDTLDLPLHRFVDHDVAEDQVGVYRRGRWSCGGPFPVRISYRTRASPSLAGGAWVVPKWCDRRQFGVSAVLWSIVSLLRRSDHIGDEAALSVGSGHAAAAECPACVTSNGGCGNECVMWAQ